MQIRPRNLSSLHPTHFHPSRIHTCTANHPIDLVVILDSTGFATWPSRDKNGAPNSAPSSTTSSSRKSDAGTSTSEEFVHPTHAMRLPISANEAKIKQISYTLEDIDEGLKGGDNELETFITEDGMRLERIRRRYGEDVGGDDYGFRSESKANQLRKV